MNADTIKIELAGAMRDIAGLGELAAGLAAQDSALAAAAIAEALDTGDTAMAKQHGQMLAACLANIAVVHGKAAADAATARIKTLGTVAFRSVLALVLV